MAYFDKKPNANDSIRTLIKKLLYLSFLLNKRKQKDQTTMLEKNSIGTSVLISPEERLTPGMNVQIIPANKAALILLLVSHNMNAELDIKKEEK